MATIVTRAGKGSPLTNTEVDDNFTNLNTDKLEKSGGTMTGDLSFGDTKKAIFGSGSDLKIFHDGGNSYIDDTGTGDLYIRGSDNVRIQVGDGAGGYDNAFYALDASETVIYFAGNRTLATTSTGIDVTGNVVSDGASLDGAVVINESGADVDFRIESDTNANAFFVDGATGSVGISTSSPQYTTQITSTSANAVTNILALHNGSNAAGTGTGARLLFKLANFENAIESRKYASIEGISTSSYNESIDLVFKTQPHASSGDVQERMRIDSSGRVGIGTSSPATVLELAAATNTNKITFDPTNTGSNGDILGGFVAENDGAVGQVAIRRESSTTNSYISFESRPTGGALTERMRIDSSGNLLVGTTDSSPVTSNVDGIVLKGNGQVQFSYTGTGVALNRKGADGNIIDLRKDGTTVGSIGTKSTRTYIGSASGASGVRFDGSQLTPFNASTQATADNTYDIGSYANRFKDLYLSGGIYLGGTGAANYLDDYEEGTFTSVTITGSDSGSGSVPCLGAYTKVGRIVTLTIQITNQTFPSFSGQLRCSLPFTVGSRIAHSPDIYYYPPAKWDAQANWVGAKAQAQAGTSYVVFPDITLDSDRQTVLTSSTTNLSGQSGIYLTFSITYQAA
jgi:hypothetical protein